MKNYHEKKLLLIIQKWSVVFMRKVWHHLYINRWNVGKLASFNVLNVYQIIFGYKYHFHLSGIFWNIIFIWVKYICGIIIYCCYPLVWLLVFNNCNPGLGLLMQNGSKNGVVCQAVSDEVWPNYCFLWQQIK